MLQSPALRFAAVGVALVALAGCVAEGPRPIAPNPAGPAHVDPYRARGPGSRSGHDWDRTDRRTDHDRRGDHRGDDRRSPPDRHDGRDRDHHGGSDRYDRRDGDDAARRELCRRNPRLEACRTDWGGRGDMRR